ncbi:MAG: S8 family serine peptidase [Bryobacterales bacterium]|nr:S8 family serine peptidase [Bryobacterales bacterium]
MTESPFAHASGRGVRVAVIDSGVNAAHPHISAVAGGISIGADAVPDSDYTDVLGHGTAVMAAIQEKAPAAEFFAIRVFQTSLRTSILQLTAALEWAIAQRMDVINLSLGTRNPAHIERFAPLLERAEAGGSLVVSAYDADGEPCYPGSLPGVIGVAVDAALDRDTYLPAQRSAGWLFRTAPYPRPIPGLPRDRNLSGISFSVANMSGFVARARETAGPGASPQAVRDALLSLTPKQPAP